MYFRAKNLNFKRHITLLLCLLVNFYPSLLTVNHKYASAQTISNYNPPVGSPPRPQRTVGSGSRGCSKGEEVALQLIAPSTGVAKTTFSHPTFSFSVSSSDLPLRFTLVEPDVAKPVYEKQLNITSSGIVRVTIPENVPGLDVGKDYRWTVSIKCSNNSPSDNISAFAWIRRIPESYREAP